MFNIPRADTYIATNLDETNQTSSNSPTLMSNTQTSNAVHENTALANHRHPVPPSIPLPHSDLTLNVGQGHMVDSTSAPTSANRSDKKPPTGGRRGLQRSRGQLRSRPLPRESNRVRSGSRDRGQSGDERFQGDNSSVQVRVRKQNHWLLVHLLK